MDKSQVAELRKRAETAQKIADDLDQLEAACTPALVYRASYKKWDTGDELLSEQLLKDVLAAGVREIRKRKEAELNHLLGNDPSSPVNQQEAAKDA